MIDCLSNRQSQYYTLWGFYTVVQFSAGELGPTETLHINTVCAVLISVWVFNIGHLTFLLSCMAQINRLNAALNAVLSGNEIGQQLVRDAIVRTSVADALSTDLNDKFARHGFEIIIVTHIVIDVCASLALIFRLIKI